MDEDEQARLPGYGEPAVVRGFRAPEALDTRFYEVRAKSILNRVPAASRMPFRWTVNPYRGCSHSCVYCLSGDSAILMADGRTRPLRDLGVGDAIYGTVRDGAHRRFAITNVLAKWSSIKRAYAVTLEDGTELIASGEHRFLTGGGWKHVASGEQGLSRRPHLTTDNGLLGPGGHVPAPARDREYRRGYLSGMIRGDGNLGSCSENRPGREIDDTLRFELALTDREVLQRVREYLLEEAVATDEFVVLQRRRRGAR